MIVACQDIALFGSLGVSVGPRCYGCPLELVPSYLDVALHLLLPCFPIMDYFAFTDALRWSTSGL